MTASLSRPTADELRRGLRLAGTPAQSAESPAGSVRRVVSVSPRSASLASDGNGSEMSQSESVFITPRVLDEKRMEAWRLSVDALVRQSTAESKRIREALEAMKTHESAAVNASRQLQERLSLGARMLKAFQTQIEQAETLVAESTAAESRLRSFVEQMDERLGATTSRLEEMEQRIDCQLKRLDAQLEKTEKRLQQAGEAATQQTKELDAVVTRQTASAQELHALFAQVEQVRGFLAEEIVSANEEVDSLAITIREPSDSLQNTLKSATTAEEKLRELVTAAGNMLCEFEVLRSAQPNVDELVAKLEPWKPVLLSDGREVISERVEGAARGIRDGVSQEIAKLIESLRSIADHAETALHPDE